MLGPLLEQLKSASNGTRVIAATVVLAVVGIFAVGATVARQPHFELLYGSLSAAESAKVQKALSDAAIPFEVSQPPGPFVVYVDESDRYRAMHAVAGSGALDRAPDGIRSGDAGLSGVFMSASEREQVVRKRAWQEVERMLEELEFVANATVTTTAGDRSPLGPSKAVTGSVMLQVRGAEELSRDQARTVANLVRFALGIEPEHLNISDQNGVSLYDGTDLSAREASGSDWLEQRLAFDRELAGEANRVLAEILGANRARVTVTSTWNHELNTVVSEAADPSARVVVSENSSSTKTPQGMRAGPGGPTGASSNVNSFGTENAAVPTGAAPAASDQVAKTESSTKEYWTPRVTTKTVRTLPQLERLSVSLFLDESLAGRTEQLEECVKAAVGFDPARSDVFSSVAIPFLRPEAAAEGEQDGAAAAGDAPAEPNPMVELALEHGVELLSALAFLFVLARTLKGARSEKPAESEPAPAEDSEAVWELLARSQIEELVKSDPERVGEILSSWAGDTRTPVGGAK